MNGLSLRSLLLGLLLVWVPVLAPAASPAPDLAREAALQGVTKLDLAGLGSTAAGRELPAQLQGLQQPGNGTTAEVAAPEAGAAASSADRQPLVVEKNFFGEDIQRGTIKQVDQDLARFGFDFFKGPDGAFLPDQLAMVGPDYVLGPGDTLKIDVWGNIEGTYAVTIDRNGEVVLPKVGVIRLWGQTLDQSKEVIHKQISKYFNGFELNVTMGSIRTIMVYLVGEVRSPGTYHLSSLSSVLTSLAAAGGPTGRGSLRNIQLKRRGKTIEVVDLYDFFLSGDNSGDLRLQSGDTVFVPVAQTSVGVAGAVRRPAIYELRDNESLTEAIALAGGVLPTAYLQKVQVNRVAAFAKKVSLDLDLRPSVTESSVAAAFGLQDRDLVQISRISLDADYVTLEGYVTRPGPYELREGMRVADLFLAYDNLLPEYFPDTAQLIRLQPPEFRPEVLTLNLGKALAQDPAYNLLLQEYDTVKVFSRREMEELPQVVIGGAVQTPGKYRLFEGMTVQDLVSAAGNLNLSAYLPEAELTRLVPHDTGAVTEQRYFNLQKALAGDPEHNLLLQVHDQIFIRGIPDYGEQPTVVLQGEVMFPGAYSIGKGEKLASVLARAGGYSDKAYLRGARLNREALKQVQRANVEKLIFEQEQEINRVSLEMAAGAMSPEDLQAAQSLLASRKEMVAKLKNAPILGRMVLTFQPLDEMQASSDNIELVAGDVISIPENPQSVTVLGQVYNQTSLVYKPGQTVAYYLDQVGGPTREANTAAMFVVRADGSVLSKEQTGMGIKWDSLNHRWVFGGFNVTELYPGDALLVPEQVERVSIMKDVKDLSQIFYQMALGAAAVASF